MVLYTEMISNLVRDKKGDPKKLDLQGFFLGEEFWAKNLESREKVLLLRFS
jgi:hypothetical protein